MVIEAKDCWSIDQGLTKACEKHPGCSLAISCKGRGRSGWKDEALRSGDVEFQVAMGPSNQAVSHVWGLTFVPESVWPKWIVTKVAENMATIQLANFSTSDPELVFWFFKTLLPPPLF